MSAARDILAKVQAAGISLAAKPEGLAIAGPRDAITDELRTLIRAHKTELLALLSANDNTSVLQASSVGANQPRNSETWKRPETLPFNTDEAAERISSWLQAMDRLPKACGAQGLRLKALTVEFALGPWAWPVIQSGWSDGDLFALDGGLIPEMSKRALHFKTVSDEKIIFITGRGTIEEWPRQALDAAPWWNDERCLVALH